MEEQMILNELEHKIGMIKTFFNNEDSIELIEGFSEYEKEGSSLFEIRLLLEDVNLFLEGVKQ